MLYITLFFTAFISATLLPSSSEVLMGGMIMQGNTNLWLIWFAATLGNVLGSCVNYWLGTQAKIKNGFQCLKKGLKKHNSSLINMVFIACCLLGCPSLATH